jgi:hypothetical protein
MDVRERTWVVTNCITGEPSFVFLAKYYDVEVHDDVCGPYCTDGGVMRTQF